MDFLVREVSYLFQDKGLAFVRLGTCGIFNPDYPVGTLFISDQIYFCHRSVVSPVCALCMCGCFWRHMAVACRG